jgi:phage terminase large subunit
MYQIYALGEKAISKSNIYSNWTFIAHRPTKFVKYVYGLDFGYNHPTALVRVYYCDNDIFIEKIIYESYLTTTQLIEKMDILNVDKTIEIMADYSRPEIIAEMNTAGYDVHNANKVVKKGIDNIKTFGVFCQEDKQIMKEYENYKWKKIGDQIMDEPVKLYDDAMDAIRYATTYIRQEYYTDDSYYSF